MNVITTSVLDIFKIGPGPSSSHTLGPMKAARHFRQACADLAATACPAGTGAGVPAAAFPETEARLDVQLYGSLATTGKGHGTDRSIIAGLLGWDPETVDPDAFDALGKDPKSRYPFEIGEATIYFAPADIRFDAAPCDLPHPNTMVFRLRRGGTVILEKEYYSIGGGFILCKGEAEIPRPIPPIPYANMRQLQAQIDRHRVGLTELLWRNETVLSGLDAAELSKRLNAIVDAMEGAVERGIATEGILPGPIGLARKAPILYQRGRKMIASPERSLILLNAYALAASEENAAGHRVVTAPTSGSSGVIPGVVHFLAKHLGVSRPLLREGLLVAGAVGGIVRHNASISGAEVGCQGEIGVASAMAAAMIAHMRGCGAAVMENAAEIALEHHLGLTCDPIGGYVQIPCIERNGMGAVKAINASRMSMHETGGHKLSLDQVIATMYQTGLDMQSRYKETSLAGLALNIIEC